MAVEKATSESPQGGGGRALISINGFVLLSLLFALFGVPFVVARLQSLLPVPTCVAALADPERSIRVFAIGALRKRTVSESDGPAVARGLLEVLAREGHGRELGEPLRSGIRLLTSISFVPEKFGDAPFVVHGVLRSLGPPALSGVAACLEDPQLGEQAAWALASMPWGQPSVTQALVRAAGSAPPRCAARSLRTLAAMQPAAGREAILAALNHTSYEVRIAAIDAIREAKVPAEQGVPALLACLRAGKHELRGSGNIHLGGLGYYVLGNYGVPAANAMRALLERGLEPELWTGINQAFAALDEEAVSFVPVLVAALRNSSDRVRHEAAMSLGHLGPAAADAAHPLAETLADSSRPVAEAAARALGFIGAHLKTVVPRLVALLDGTDAGRAAAAARALGSLKARPLPEQVVPALRKALTHPSPLVRDAAHDARRWLGSAASQERH